MALNGSGIQNQERLIFPSRTTMFSKKCRIDRKTDRQTDDRQTEQ